MITFTCVFVRGYVGYSPIYVKHLASMIRRHYIDEHRIICLTDQPRMVDKYVDDVIEVATPPHSFPWWAKIELFCPYRFEGRVCYLDLDVLIWRDLHPIVDYPTTFALIPHAGMWEGKGLLKVVKKYNSSVMVWDAGVTDSIYDNWRPEVQHRLWGDQDWISEQRPYERTMPLAWFPRLSEFKAQDGAVPPDARVILCKKPKNTVAAQQWDWFKEAWQ